MKLAVLIAAPLEAVWLWIFSWSLRGLHQTDALAQWFWSLAFVIHLPGSSALVFFGGLNSIYFWPVLFVSGFSEFWAAMIVITGPNALASAVAAIDSAVAA
jgi:hypothetical protein